LIEYDGDEVGLDTVGDEVGFDTVSEDVGPDPAGDDVGIEADVVGLEADGDD
jgi:hypothetical protein